MPLPESSYKKLILFFAIFLAFVYLCYYFDTKSPNDEVFAEKSYRNGSILRVMTFNIWYGGTKVEDGIRKIAKHIKFVDPDVVAIQEVHNNITLAQILQELGYEWSGVQGTDKIYPNNGIVTKHKLFDETFSEVEHGIGVRISINSTKTINFWGLHLFHRSFGLYAAHNKLVTSPDQIMAGETSGLFYNGKNFSSRVDNIRELLRFQKFRKDLANVDRIPLLIAGDFNSPSHLDWVERNKHLHGGWVFDWPVTKLLMEKANMIDSYRKLYPDPIKNAGTTWSTIQRFSGPEWAYMIPEPQDRIDFIFYQSPNLIPIKSYTYAGALPLRVQEQGHSPYEYNNDWPSDHFSVITEFLHTGV